MTRCVLVLGGVIDNYSAIRKKLSDDDYFIYCDRGLRHFKALDRRPDLAVGDFDSFPSPEGVESVVFPPRKDDTDALCGLKEGIKRGFKEFLIIGAFGERIDHTLANIYLLDYLSSHNLDGTIYDGSSYLKIVSEKKVTIEKGCRYFSLLALFSKAEGVDISGAKYNTENAVIEPSFQYGVSNEVEDDEAVVSVKRGKLLLAVILKE